MHGGSTRATLGFYHTIGLGTADAPLNPFFNVEEDPKNKTTSRLLYI